MREWMNCGLVFGVALWVPSHSEAEEGMDPLSGLPPGVPVIQKCVPASAPFNNHALAAWKEIVLGGLDGLDYNARTQQEYSPQNHLKGKILYQDETQTTYAFKRDERLTIEVIL